MIASGDRLDLDDDPGPQGRQALDRRRRRQGVDLPGAAGRRLRRAGADDVGARARPHRRHARQARGDPRLPHRARAGRVPARAARCGLVLAGQSERLVPADRRAVRAARRDRDRGVDPAHRLVDPVEEGRRGDRRAADGRQGRRRARSCRRAPTLAAWRARWCALGRGEGLKVVALLTAMDQPLGREVGNASELREAIEVLRGGGPADTRALTVRLGAEMLVLGRVARDRRRRRAPHRGGDRQRRGAGAARPLHRAAGGRPRACSIARASCCREARQRIVVVARRAGVVTAIDARAVGRAATLLGAGRLRKEDRVDPAVGITLRAQDRRARRRAANRWPPAVQRSAAPGRRAAADRRRVRHRRRAPRAARRAAAPGARTDHDADAELRRCGARRATCATVGRMDERAADGRSTSDRLRRRRGRTPGGRSCCCTPSRSTAATGPARPPRWRRGTASSPSTRAASANRRRPARSRSPIWPPTIWRRCSTSSASGGRRRRAVDGRLRRAGVRRAPPRAAGGAGAGRHARRRRHAGDAARARRGASR